MYRLILVAVNLISVTIAYDGNERCPVAMEWRLRAKSNCSKIDSYVCLHSISTNSFKESCQGRNFGQMGGKLVWNPKTDFEDCKSERYQPFNFETDGNSDCIFVKSECGEDGQTIVSNGSSINDRTCRCDYRRGFSFITKPKNICFCIPSEEDCSCYVSNCEKLSQDYECMQNSSLQHVNFRCSKLTTPLFAENYNGTIVTTRNDATEKLERSIQRFYVIISVISVLFLICIIFGSIIYAIRLNDMPDKEPTVTPKEPEDENCPSDDDLAKIPDPEPAAKKTRFKEMPSKAQIEKLAQARFEDTTNQQTQWGVTLLRGWLTENGYNEKFEEMDASTLNERLSYFYGSLQTKRGTDYSKSALVGIRAAIHRHLTSPPFNKPFNLKKDQVFMNSNHVLTGMIKTLKREGKDVKVYKKAVAEGDIHKLYQSGVFDTDSPVTLQNKVFWDILHNFGCRGQEGLHTLKTSSFGKYTDDKGHVYYKMNYIEANKTHHGGDSKETTQEVRMYAKPGDKNCPVASFEFYLSKLSPKCDALFQQPLLHPKTKVWYAAQGMGKNKISKMMATISKEAGLSTIYTNHCICATVADVDDLSIMSVTGHRNIKSLESYIEGPSESQRRDLSTTLQNVATGTANTDNVLVSKPSDSHSQIATVTTSQTGTYLTIQQLQGVHLTSVL